MSTPHTSRRRWALPSVRSIRVMALVLTLGGVGILLGSARWEAEIAHVSGDQRTWSAVLRRGCVEVWRDYATITGDVVVQGKFADRAPGFHLRFERSYNSWVSLPWRPFHNSTLAPPTYTSKAHGATVPLWPIAVAGLLLLGYTHGLMVGARKAAVGRCRKCGYDLGKLALGTPCPECGTPDYRASGSS